MVDRLTLHVGDEPCYVDDCHVPWTLPSRPMAVPNDAPASDGAPRPGGSASTIDADGVLDLFGRITDRAADVVSGTTDWGESGRRPGQYLVDLDVDDVCVGPLLAAGFGVLSEESGLQFPAGAIAGDAVVVVDPLDGSTNASLGLPWCATSLCLVIDAVPTAAMVANLATGARYAAIRGAGATLDGQPISIESAAPLGDAVIAVSGLPGRHYGWRQFRAMGASALDICAVASGSFDGFVDMSPDAHGVWDYLGGMLVVQEAGGVVIDALGRDMVVLDHSARRTPIAANSATLLDQLLAERTDG